MKTISPILLSILFIIISNVSFSQSIEEESEANLSRKERKLLKRENNFKKMIELAEQRNLLIEAYELRGRRGASTIVNGNNFVRVNGDEFVLQTSIPGNRNGNAVGGSTGYGKITEYQVQVDEKKKSVSIIAFMDMNGAGQSRLYITLNGTGNNRADYINSFGNKISFVGQVGTSSESDVYQIAQKI